MKSRDVTSRPITVAPHIQFRILPSAFRMPQFRILPIAIYNPVNKKLLPEARRASRLKQFVLVTSCTKFSITALLLELDALVNPSHPTDDIGEES